MSSSNNNFFISNLIKLFYEKKILILFLLIVIILGIFVGNTLQNLSNNQKIEVINYELTYFIKENENYFNYKSRLGLPLSEGILLDNINNKFIKTNYYFALNKKINHLKGEIYRDPILLFIDYYKNMENKNNFIKLKENSKIYNSITSSFFNQRISQDTSYTYKKIAKINLRSNDLNLSKKIINDYFKFILNLIKDDYVQKLNELIRSLNFDINNIDSVLVTDILNKSINDVKLEITKITNNPSYIIIDNENPIIQKKPKDSKLIEIGLSSTNSLYYPIIITVLSLFLYLLFVIIIFRKKIYNDFS